MEVKRTNSKKKNHHIWNNNGTWFVHFMMYPKEGSQKRIRRSLKTNDVKKARKVRDTFFEKVKVLEIDDAFRMALEHLD